MSIFTKTWQWLDGNKSAIGGYLTLISQVLPVVFPPAAVISESILKVGMIITSLGLGHKTLKAIPNDSLPKILQTRLDPNGEKPEAMVSEPRPYDGER